MNFSISISLLLLLLFLLLCYVFLVYEFKTRNPFFCFWKATNARDAIPDVFPVSSRFLAKFSQNSYFQNTYRKLLLYLEKELNFFLKTSQYSPLREKCPNTKFFCGPYSVRMQENTDQKKLRIWTLSLQKA